MKLKNRLTPYPILSQFNDDYINSSFTCEYDVINQFSNVFCKITFDLNNKEIQMLLENHKAVFSVHVECPTTCFRKVYNITEKEIEFKLNHSNVSKTIEIRTFVILTEDIHDFYSPDFHSDYSGDVFDLKSNQVLAIGTAMDFSIQKEDKEFDNLPSIIKISKLTDIKKGAMAVNTDSDKHIIIGLSEEVFDKYAKLGKNIYKSTAFAIVIFPAMLVVLQRMHDNKDNPDINQNHWFLVIKSILEKNGKSLDSLDINTDNLLVVCQALFADPISSAFDELFRLSEGMN